jgi:hypothetical protein
MLIKRRSVTVVFGCVGKDVVYLVNWKKEMFSSRHYDEMHRIYETLGEK